MRGYVNTFWVPKRGAAAAEYEDAFWVGPDESDDGEYDLRFLRVVLADGASESMLASRWASHLVAEFGETPEDIGTGDGFIAVYQQAADSWDAVVARYKQERAERSAPIQWYEEPGLVKGAHSTVLIVEFRGGEDNGLMRWTAVALGDSCVFHVRDGELCGSFPMKNSNDFSNQPPLLSSRGTPVEALSRHLSIDSGELLPGDAFYLATDALSAWFLTKAESGEEPWRTLRVLDDIAAGEFAELIDTLRSNGKIRDDDTTLVRVDVW